MKLQQVSAFLSCILIKSYCLPLPWPAHRQGDLFPEAFDGFERAAEPQALPQGCREPAYPSVCPCAQTVLTVFSCTWSVVQAFCPSRSNNMTQGVSHDGTQEKWEAWIAIVSPFWNEAPEPTTFFTLLEPGDMRFLIIPLKKCSRTVFHRNELRTKKTDTKTKLLILRA